MGWRADTLIPLARATDHTAAGGKAAALARAVGNGYPVPDGVVIPVAAAAHLRSGNDATCLGTLAGLVEQLGGSVAVRSSAIDEDGLDASFAGQYETVLRVTSDDALVEAFRRCVRSGETESVNGSRHQPAPTSGMAVLVQRMLRPSAAGVAFSVDPVTGDDEVVIEAAAGIGDALLAGEISGERWTVGAEPRAVTASPAVLDPSDARRIASLCRRLAVHNGLPVDIEWGIEDGELWLLQVRPITALPRKPTEPLPNRQTFVREPRVHSPLHPLSFTSWFPITADVFAQVFEEFGIPAAGIDCRHHLGWAYTRTIPLMDRGKDGGEPPLPVLRLLLRVSPSSRRRMANALTWNGDRSIETLIDDWVGVKRASTTARTHELRERDVASMTNDEVADHVDEIQGHLRSIALDHFRLSVGAMAIPMGRLGMFVEARLGWSTTDAFTLVQGFGHATVAQGRAVRRLIDGLGRQVIDEAIADPPTLLQHDAARDYLDQFGHIVHLELADPTESDDLQLVVDHLRRHLSFADNDRTASDPTAAARDMEAQANRELSSDADRATFGRLLGLARRGRPLGDETERTAFSALSLMRVVGLEAGSRFALAGRLRDPRDVWFLELEELLALLRSPSAPLPDIDRRRRELRWAQTHPAPGHLGPPPPPMLPPSIVGRKYHSTLGAAFWSFGAMEGDTINHTADGQLLHGLPGSPGAVTGTARTVRSPSEFERLEPNDIMVCEFTTAAWSPVFSVLGGLVTERGGPLSHPATLAREYGLPAVLSAPRATERIPDGSRVRLDGALGVVEILDDPACG